MPPPSFYDLVDRTSSKDFVKILGMKTGPEIEGVYEHWDHLRHLQPPADLTPENWWLGIKYARRALYRQLTLTDKSNQPVQIGVTDYMLRLLHFLDRETSGSIQGLDRSDGDENQRYLIRSLVEEAMTSSQLEGASTTRQAAKEMLASGRKPRDRGEQMIWNNYQAMRQLARWRESPLTPDAIFEMHRVLTADAIDDTSAAGRLRRANEQIEVVDWDGGNVLHRPPPASELPERLERLCDFANGSDSGGFLHTVIRAIALHFQIGYDHPFVDGNGRTARAIFYWSMLRSGYWLTEYLSISNALKKAPAQYNRAYLYTETDDSDLGYFVCHQLSILENAVDGLREYIARKSRDHRLAETLLKPGSKLATQLNHRQREILLHALRDSSDIYRIADHQSAQQISYQTARNDLLGLAQAGLMQQQKAGKAFIFTPVHDLADRIQK